MSVQEKTFFGLQDATSGELVRIDAEAGDSCCSSYVQLCSAKHLPVLELETQAELSSLLMCSTPWYNAHRPETANWGSFRREDLVPVRVRVIQEVEALTLREPLQVKTESVREIPRRVAERYADGPLPYPEDSNFCFWLAELPEGMSIEQANEYVGESVHPQGDRYMRRELLKAVPPPEEYAPLVDAKRGVLLLTRCAVF